MTKYATYNESKDFILTTDTTTNKNLSSGTYIYSQSSFSVGNGNYVKVSHIVPLHSDTRFYQIYVNIDAFDGSSWVALPARDKMVAGGRQIAMNVSQNGSSLSLDIYYVNPGSTWSVPSHTIRVKRRDFVDEIQ